MIAAPIDISLMVGDALLHCGKEVGERRGSGLHDLRQEQDERGAEHRAGDRPEAADDDHGKKLDGKQDGERLRGDEAEVVRIEGAPDAGEEARYAEGENPVAGQVDPHHLGRKIVIANGDQRPAIARAHQVGDAARSSGRTRTARHRNRSGRYGAECRTGSPAPQELRTSRR